MRLRRRAGLAVITVLAAAGVRADEARISMPAALAARVEAGRRCGMEIALEPGRGGVEVTVSRSVRAFAVDPTYPLADPAACGDDEARAVLPSFRLPPELRALAGKPGSALARLAAVVAYVSQAVTLDDGDRGAQDASAVLARGTGRCSGRANAAVGGLRVLGIPARVVQGILIAGKHPRWHRWGEAWLGPLGWVPFDPGAAVGLVSVRYLPLVGAGEGASLAGVRLEAIDERGYAGVPVRDGLRVLPAGGITVRCLGAATTAEVTAVLQGPDGSRWARRGRGEVVFGRMLPGRYRLVCQEAGSPAVLSLTLGGARDVLVALGAERRAGS